jgi:hypothetical protein
MGGEWAVNLCLNEEVEFLRHEILNFCAKWEVQ